MLVIESGTIRVGEELEREESGLMARSPTHVMSAVIRVSRCAEVMKPKKP